MAKHVQKLATRYARSLLLAVGGEGQSPRAVADALQAFVTEWWSSPLLAEAVQNPMFEKEQRLQALRAVAGKAGLSDIATRFIQVVFERDRVAALPQIVQTFSELADEKDGIVKVKVITAQSVAQDEKHSVEESLRRKIKGSLVFHWAEDPAILGGMLVSYGAKVLDGSLRGKLERIERRLMA